MRKKKGKTETQKAKGKQEKKSLLLKFVCYTNLYTCILLSFAKENIC